MKTNGQYQIDGSVVRMGKGSGVMYTSKAGLKQRSMMTEEGMEKDVLSSHPSTGQLALGIYHEIMDYFRRQGYTAPPSMIKHVREEGLPTDLEGRLHWCESLAAIREKEKPNGELYVLSLLLPKKVYKAIHERHELVWFSTPHR